MLVMETRSGVSPFAWSVRVAAVLIHRGEAGRAAERAAKGGGTARADETDKGCGDRVKRAGSGAKWPDAGRRQRASWVRRVRRAFRGCREAAVREGVAKADADRVGDGLGGGWGVCMKAPRGLLR
jgi:hypothetical protein